MIDKRWALPTALLLFITLILSACAPGGAASDGLIISEVMAKNNGALADDEGNYPDWIELHNPTDKAVNLKGYSLTDDSRKKGKFVFPEMEIGAGDYLVVFASGTEPGGRGEPGRSYAFQHQFPKRRYCSLRSP